MVGWPAKMLAINTIDLPLGMKGGFKGKEKTKKNTGIYRDKGQRSLVCGQQKIVSSIPVLDNFVIIMDSKLNLCRHYIYFSSLKHV